MKKRLNSNHQKPCACFECDRPPKRPRYTKDEWLKTWPGNKKLCRFCGTKAGYHSDSRTINGLFVGGACFTSDLRQKDVESEASEGVSTEAYFEA